MLANTLAAAAEECDKQRELIAGDQGRREHDDGGDDGPRGDPGAERRRTPWGESEGQDGDVVASGVRGCDHRGLKQQAGRKACQRSRPVTGNNDVKQSAKSDTCKRHGEYESQGEDGAAEEWPEHSVPHKFHQKEHEADYGGGGKSEAASRGRERVRSDTA